MPCSRMRCWVLLSRTVMLSPSATLTTLPGEGIGDSRGSCQQQECGYDDPAHSRPSWVMTDQRLAKGHLDGNCGHSDIFMFQCIGRVETILVDLTASTCSYRIRQGRKTAIQHWRASANNILPVATPFRLLRGLALRSSYLPCRQLVIACPWVA